MEVRIDTYKKAVVNLNLRSEVSLGRDTTGDSVGTGFVVDAKKGIIVTNQHVTGLSPKSKVEVTFVNGESVEAKHLYYDPWHDFAFLKVNPKELSFRLTEAKLGEHRELVENEQLILIGNNEQEAYSIKRGRLTKLFVDKAPNDIGRHSHHVHTDYDSAGGSSGSPVWGEEGKVVGLHTSGSDTSSFELRIDYVIDALKHLKQSKVPPRGDIHLSINALQIAKALKYYGYSLQIIERAKKLNPRLQNVLQVFKVLQESEAARSIRIGDIIIAIDDKEIGEDLYAFDRLVNEKVGQSVCLKLFRQGKTLEVSVPVDDAEAEKPCRFARFAGSTFHDVTPDLGLTLNIPCDGVFISESASGTSFADLGDSPADEDQGYKRRIIIHALNGKPIHNLTDFVKVAKPMKSGDAIVVHCRDVFERGCLIQSMEVDIENRYSPLQLFQWNRESLDWELQR